MTRRRNNQSIKSYHEKKNNHSVGTAMNVIFIEIPLLRDKETSISY